MHPWRRYYKKFYWNKDGILESEIGRTTVDPLDPDLDIVEYFPNEYVNYYMTWDDAVNGEFES
jgi:hypothetical protein